MTASRMVQALACCATTIVSLACAKDTEDEKKAAVPVVTASTAVARVEPFVHVVSAIGTVVARPGRFAALSAPSATRIARVFVASGQRVVAGAPLVEFEQAAFVSASNAAQAALVAAQRSQERAERLAREGIVPRKEVEQAAADLAAARAAAVTARRAQQLSVLRSPVSGVVTTMNAVLGANADAGQVLVEVADPSAFDVELSLGAVDAGVVLPGARVKLSAGEKAGGDELGEGRVATVAATLDSVSRSVAVRVTLATPRRGLRLGESVYGEIAAETTPGAVVVPANALVPEGSAFKVYVVDARGVALGREVQIGGRFADKVQIVKGLKGGETVVTEGAFGMQDSARVARPVPVSP